MKQLLVLVILLSFSAVQVASFLNGYGSPLIHALCYGKVFKRRATEGAAQVFTMDSLTYNHSLTDDRELRIDNNLFDILSVEASNGVFIVKATKDENETQLLEVLHHIKQAFRQASKGHSNGKNVSAWLFKLYCGTRNMTVVQHSQIVLPLEYSSFSATLLPGISTLPCQPPDVIGS